MPQKKTLQTRQVQNKYEKPLSSTSSNNTNDYPQQSQTAQHQHLVLKTKSTSFYTHLYELESG